jgi:plastocyanin
MKMLVFASAAAIVLGMPSLANAETHVITISNMKFGAAPSGVHAGDTIVWRNKDAVEHSATADSGAFDVEMEPGKEAKTVVKSAGSIAYHCRYHPMMKSTIKVDK